MKAFGQYFFPSLLRLFLLPIFLLSCASYEQFKQVSRELDIPSKTFKTTFAQTYQAVLKIAKKYDLEYYSSEIGVVRTRWIDNTLELNFSDSFATSDSIKSAKFKLVIKVVKGFRNGREVSKVSVFKRQLVEQDFLQGLKYLQSDGIFERSLLYRIERILAIENRLQEIEKARQKEQEESLL